MLDKNSFQAKCPNGTRHAARTQYLQFLCEQKTDYDYNAIFENTRAALISEDGADEDTAQVVAMECVEQLKSSVASIKAKRSLLEGLIAGTSSQVAAR